MPFVSSSKRKIPELLRDSFAEYCFECRSIQQLLDCLDPPKEECVLVPTLKELDFETHSFTEDEYKSSIILALRHRFLELESN